MATKDKLIKTLEKQNYNQRKLTKIAEKDADFYRSAAYELLGQWNWADDIIQKLLDKLQLAHDHNVELLDRVQAYNGGLVDKEYINKRQDPKKDARHKEVYNDELGKSIKLGKHFKYPYETYVDYQPSTPKKTIHLNTIIDACKTDLQRQVVKFYYDKELDSYGSFQKTANWIFPDDKNGRQKVRSILNTVEQYMRENINKATS